MLLPDPSSSRHGAIGAVAVGCAAALFAVAVPVIAHLGAEPEHESPNVAAAAHDNAQRDEKLLDAADSLAEMGIGGTPKNWDDVELTEASQITYVDLRDGSVTGTANQRIPRSALSLSKIYIADYVLDHGTSKEIFDAMEMVATSDDDIAERLYKRYPKAVDATAKKYDLLSTHSGDTWGYAVTSTYDAVSFIVQLMQDDPASPILVAMSRATPVAADGYKQNFGTAVLPGAWGTKWGWSNERDQNSSVTFGKDFVAAAAVSGSAEDLTRLVKVQLGDKMRVEKPRTKK